jgi:hypothetical protein
VNLFASLDDHEPRTFEPLAVVEVEADSLRKDDAHTIRRYVVGKIVERGPAWERWLESWKPNRLDCPYHVEDARHFTQVEWLAVEHDIYPSRVAVHVDGDTLHMVLWESFHGTVEEWQAVKAKRKEATAWNVLS